MSEEKQLRDLSVRVINCLHHLGIKTKDQARAAMANGTLRPGNVNARNYGGKCHREVLQWLDLDPGLNDRQVHWLRARMAFELRHQTWKLSGWNRQPGQQLPFHEISRVMRLGSKEKARALVMKGTRLAAIGK